MTTHYGITRLNVYAGEAAGYLLTDPVEQDFINGTNNSGANPTNAKSSSRRWNSTSYSRQNFR